MHNGDVLGNEGRKALNACVKVKIYGKPETRKYDVNTSLERVRGCYAKGYHFGAISISPGSDFKHRLSLLIPFIFDKHDMESVCDIVEIHDALVKCDKRSYVDKYPREGPESDKLKDLIDKRRADVERELEEATADPGRRRRYSWVVAQRRVRDCFAGKFPSDQTTVLRWHEYSQSEALPERLVRDCFASIFFPGFLGDTEIFHMVTKDESHQTYDIFDIKKEIDSFDAKTFVDAFKYESEGTPRYGETKQKVDEQRASVQQEYELATTNDEIEHGSGFVVHDHFIITNRHVIETYLNESKSHEIRISNEAIGELACKVAHYDAGKDLALLYCPDLKLEQSGICPLKLSSQALLPGMSVFSFGYPMSHTGETALFVSGNVSGSKKTLAGHSMAVLNCALNSGNSGGPVLCWVKGQLRVVGVATQKHFKEILSFEERVTIEKIRKSLQTHAITDHHSYSPSCQTPMFLLTLKLYDALETHSQFNLSNALPGHLVVDFIKDSVGKYTGEYKEELAEIIKLSEDQVNILPSGHLSASQCCIQ